MRISAETRGAKELADLAATGEVVIPRFQRSFVWGVKDIKDLLVSVLSGYYVGSLLFQRIGNPNKPMFSYEPIEGSEDLNRLSPTYMVLDGQQRITALFYALYGPQIPPQGRKTPVKFMIDLKKLAEGNIEDSIIAVRDRDASKYDNESVQFGDLVVPCTQLRNIDTWFERFIDYTSERSEKGSSRKIVKKAMALLRQNLLSKENLEVPVWQLQADVEPADVCSIFEKINNTGKSLTIFELVHARLFRNNIDLARMWEEAIDENVLLKTFSQDDPRLGENVLRLICLQAGQECKRANLINLTADNVTNHWPTAIEYFESAIRRLMEMASGGYGVIDKKWTPYAPMIPALARLLQLLKSSNIQDAAGLGKIHMWYWLSVFGERFAGSTDTTVHQDVKDVAKWMEGGSVPQDLEVTTLGDLNLRLHDTQGSAVYKGAMCLISLRGAKDFFLDDTIRLSEREDHHIFPQNYLKRKGFDIRKDKTKINSIVNRTLIADKTNNIIRDKAPSEYLRIMEERLGGEKKVREVLETHFIDEAAYEAMRNDSYDAFLDARESSITEDIRKRCNL